MIEKAIIISISGYKLTKIEKKIFKEHLPWGVILFKRNIKNFQQLKKLILSIGGLLFSSLSKLYIEPINLSPHCLACSIK